MRRARVLWEAFVARFEDAFEQYKRRHMMQEWSDIIDAWVAGKKRVPVLIRLRGHCLSQTGSRTGRDRRNLTSGDWA